MPSSYADMNNEQLRLNAQEGDVEAAFLLGKRLLAVRGGAMEGVEYLKGAPVRATDLRAGAAMIIAGLAAHGVTKIEDIEHIQRGYEDIVEKFVGLGADMYLMLDPTNSDTAKIG